MAVVNSRDVAEAFERPHKDVLSSIRVLEIGEDFRRSWFRETTVTDGYGRQQPAFDMTRDGFTILAMGWTGAAAMACGTPRDGDHLRVLGGLDLSA